MIGYRIDMSCPSCANELVDISSGRPCTTETKAIAGCPSCGQRWLVTVFLAAIPRTEVDLTKREKNTLRRRESRKRAKEKLAGIVS